MLGSWKVEVNTSGMPQKVASAFGDLALVGAEYEFIAYLGNQQVNGTNHAILAKQTILAGKDVTNIVVMIFNEKADAVTLAGIEKVVESGGELGGIKVDVDTEIGEDAQATLDATIGELVGVNVKPFAVLGTQVTKGTTYIFAATTEPVVLNPEASAVLVVANALTKDITFIDLLQNKADASALVGYAFTWLKK